MRPAPTFCTWPSAVFVFTCSYMCSGMLSGLVSRMSSLTGSASDLALNQIKANRALIDEVTQRWSLDKVEEKEVKVNVLDKPTSELMMDDLRGAPLALLNQLLKKCAPGSREYKLVDSQIKKAGPATKAKGPATSGGRTKALDPKYTKYLNLGPGQLKLAVAEQQKILDKLKKGKPTQESRKRVYEVTKEIDEIGKIFADKVHYSGVMTKKGGKTGNKGADERWFALEDLGSGVYSLEYYEPKKYKLLGQIPIDNKCLLDAGEGNNKGTTTYTLDITCTDENRTYYLFTTKKTERDTWLKYIKEDAGVADMNETYDDDQEIDDEPEEDDDDDDLE